MRKRALGASAAVIIAVGFAAPFEGTAYEAYPDPAHGWKVPTICRGHTLGVKRGDTATEEQCRIFEILDMRESERIFDAHVKTAVPDRPKAMFVSFINNVGTGKRGVKDGFVELKKGGPSGVLKRLQAGDIAGACDQLKLWTKAGGKVLRGLERRRMAERAECLRGLE